ncbi:MAG: phosphoenolpyruvate carboxykinase (ATP) [Candidatus Bipolaricaulota bacterium]|nr:phosphoenolpyruvate carboxykinase (ATP) [Candidatus Bipolaricaulota bacterium]
MSLKAITELEYVLSQAYWNLEPPALYEEAIRRNEVRLASSGALVAYTGRHTGRSPHDKFIVKEPSTAAKVWWGPVNSPISPAHCEQIYQRLCEHLKTKKVFVQDLEVCAAPRYRTPIRVITEYAWHSLFARHIFLRTRQRDHTPQITVICAPSFHAIPERDGTRSETFIILHLAQKTILIGGTPYAGEIKKSVFTLLNYLLPQQGVLPMHCSANQGADGQTALFFGLSGTGKTTLSTDPHRPLIGDDEHGWCDEGIFNFEGGCYAKVIGLRRETEPEIYHAVQRFGAILENVVLEEPQRTIRFDDASITENTRAAYPIEFLSHINPTGMGPPPRTIFFLTYDAFGVLPPISLLRDDQVIPYFLLGYTAKVAGTERGVAEPTATFSPCFGGPFWPLSPQVYAQMLRDRVARSGVKVWLLNTGTTGGPYGVGKRISLPYTRALVRAALDGSLERVSFEEDLHFRLCFPTYCPGLSALVTNPKSSWKDAKAYSAKAQELAQLFHDQLKKYNIAGGSP